MTVEEVAGHDDVVTAFDDQFDVIGLADTGECEMSILDAVRAGVAEWINQSWADERLSAAARAKSCLSRAGDPLGLACGVADPQNETNAPTAERTVNRGVFMPASVSQDRKADAWRHVPVVEAMVNRGQFSRDEAGPAVEAAKRFYRDFVLGHRVGGLVAKWGDPTSGSGTPVRQQSPKVYTDRHGVLRECMGPDDRRTHHHSAWVDACRAVGMIRCPVTGRESPGIMVTWLLKLVCEDYSVATETTPRLEDAGRAYIGCKSASQASAAGAALIKAGIDRLVQHYDAADRCR